jgi:predicted nucleotidyltransferase component of viral defense system
MSPGKNPNAGHSIFQRLLNYAKKHREDFNLLLLRYGIERLLYRLSISPHGDKFILKGASLFLVWLGQNYRVTRDADLLCFGPENAEQIAEVFRGLCQTVTDGVDGIVFVTNSVRAMPIREEQEYGGIRVTLLGMLHKARIPLQIDIGFGDAITPAPEKITFPPLLKAAAPQLLAYPRETMVAEKLQAIVVLGIANSRMKDFYDLYVLARDFAFDGATLTAAIKATFKRRKTEVPHETPLALREDFGRDNMKSVQWKAFVRKAGLQKDMPELQKVLLDLRKFLLLPLKGASGQGQIPKSWGAGGPWVHAESEIGST